MPPENIDSTYPVDFERTAIAVGYKNVGYVADEVLPRISVGHKEYRYTVYPLDGSFTVPDTRVGRRSQLTMMHFTAEERPGAGADYGLADAIPDDDIQNAPPSAADPIDRSTMMLTDLLMIDREKRASALVFDATKYAAANKLALSGNTQWSDFTNSNPIANVLGAMESMIVPPTHLLLGSSVWAKLRTHPKIVKAVHGNEGDTGIVMRARVAELFELEGIIVGARVGQRQEAGSGRGARAHLG